MEFGGSVRIEAPRQAVWDFLADFEGLASCGPGVESVERLDDRRARVTAKLGLGFITSRFSIDLELGELEPPERATLTGRGEAPGTQVEGVAEMRLTGPAEGPTDLDWRAEVNLFGSLAGIGARMIESTAGRMIDQAFDCVRARLAAQPG
ncbi:MAG TPA: carbon monoxide dehydrogenase subunit G [Candidatus Limnocylindrales bacterium]|jgi:carbon monoxide dehydrogenase subunit G